MRYRQLGRSGLRVSAVGLGGNGFGKGYGFGVDESDAVGVIHRALDLGINCLDTADVYGRGASETIIGKAIAGRRHDVVVATKVQEPMGTGPNDAGLSRTHIMDGVEASLRRLGTEYIDLYQLHHPDPDTPLEETLRALDDLVRAGKVRYVGCSNFAAWQLVEAVMTSRQHGWAPLVSTQPAYNLLRREAERELLPACARFGVGILPYWPLEAGVLTGKYRLGEPMPEGSRGAARAGAIAPRLTEQTAAAVARLDGWARKRGHTLAELAIAWLLAHPEVSSVIAGATRPAQVEANAAAAEWELAAGDLAAIDALLAG